MNIPKETNMGPRRNDILRNTKVELKIREAMREVESLGCHELLTKAVMLLDDAFNCVADYIEK